MLSVCKKSGRPNNNSARTTTDHTMQSFSAVSSRRAAAARPSPSFTSRTGSASSSKLAALKDNFARLSASFPPETMAKVVVRDASGAEVATIPNAEGKRASLVFFAALAAKRAGGVLDAAAAEEGLELYDEVTAEAVAHRGSHPNIDLLLDVKSGAIDGGPLRIEVVKA